MKLCLGTAQLGSDYGVRGNKRPSLVNCIEMLKTAVFDHDIYMLDTAAAYGEAEAVLGNFLDKYSECKKYVSVISKLAPDALANTCENQYEQEIVKQIRTSLRRLRIERLNGFMLHNAVDIYRTEIVEALAATKRTGLTDNIGVSVYEPEEAIAAAKNKHIDYIQVPYNVLDQRLEHTDFFRIAKGNNKTIFARSAFLQGLLVMEAVPEHLGYAAPSVKKFQDLSKFYGLDYPDACINYIMANEQIDYLAIGVDSPKELDLNIRAMRIPGNPDFVRECRLAFRDVERKVLVPSLWRKE